MNVSIHFLKYCVLPPPLRYERVNTILKYCVLPPPLQYERVNTILKYCVLPPPLQYERVNTHYTSKILCVAPTWFYFSLYVLKSHGDLSEVKQTHRKILLLSPSELIIYTLTPVALKSWNMHSISSDWYCKKNTF